MQISAGILAGGKSSRMGQNKALLIWKEQTLLEHLAKLLAAVPEVEELLISVADAAEYQEIRKRWQEEKELVFAEDVRQGYGPLEGLYQLLSHGKHPWIFVTATDLPLVCPELIRGLLDRLPLGGEGDLLQPEIGGDLRQTGINGDLQQSKIQAIIPRAEGRIHPLCGLYHKSALPVLEQLFSQEQHKVKALLEQLSVAYVEVESLGLEPSVLENVNTPEEYQKIAGSQ